MTFSRLDCVATPEWLREISRLLAVIVTGGNGGIGRGIALAPAVAAIERTLGGMRL